MKPLQASSGDLNADRRADYAEMLCADGDHAAAAELLLGALELTPQWAMGWFRLGEMQQRRVRRTWPRRHGRCRCNSIRRIARVPH